MVADLTPYVPRLALDWDEELGGRRHAAIEGTLVFADVSGFTRLSERLASLGGREGAEQVADVVDLIFGELLTVAVARGGEMLKYGGDAVLLLFRGTEHPARGVAAGREMQARLASVGRIDTGVGSIRMRMSVGVHAGTIDAFLVGSSHRELVVAGPAATRTIEAETAAGAGEVLVSADTAAALPESVLGEARDGFVVVRRTPNSPTSDPVVVARAERASAFVPVGLRNALLQSSLAPEHRLVTQAFVHVMALDAVLATQGADAAADALDATISALQDAFERYGVCFLATDIAPSGTKVIAVAGAPAALEQPEARVVAALDAVRSAGCPLPLRAGVHCGRVFTGEVGPPFRRTYTTIGDVTNTAARVMGHAREGEVLTLGPLAEAVRSTHRLRQMAPFMAKGKSEPLVPFRIEGPADVAAEAAGGREHTPFTGREAELARLLDRTGAARSGVGAAIEIVGPAGIGKSRLAGELVRALDLPGLRVCCEPFEADTPFFAVRQLVRFALGGAATASTAALRAAVDERCPSILPWVPLLAGALDLDVDDTPETAALDARYRLQQTAIAIGELLRAFLTEPAVVIVEDVQWADESSGQVLAHLEATAGFRPYVLVLTRRPASAADVGAALEADAVVLEPLEAPVARRLVAAACGDRPLPPYRVDEVVARGQGNPLFLEGLLRIALGDGESELPDSVEAVVAAEIDRLDPTGRRLLRIAAVQGDAVDLTHLAASAAADGLEATVGRVAAVARATGDMLVVDGPDRLRFRHHLTRDVAYAGLTYRRRRHLHGHAADLLKAELGGRTDDRIGLLAMHEWHAGRFADCWAHSRIAGERAVAKHAQAEAMASFRRALDAAGHLKGEVPPSALSDVWEQLGDACSMAGESAKASAAFKQARRNAATPVAMARLCGKEARLAEMAGSRARARRWFRRGLEAIDAVDGREAGAERAWLLAGCAWTAAADGRADRALALAEQAVAQGLHHGNREAVAHAYVVMDGALVTLGRDAEADHTASALALFEETGNVAARGVALNNLGVRAYFRGEWGEALRLYEEARRHNLAAGNVIDAGYQAYNVAEILVDQGHLDEAESMLDGLDALWRSVRFDAGLLFVTGLRGVVALRRQECEEAAATLDRVRVRLHEWGLRTQALSFDVAAAEAHLHRGDVGSARSAAGDARRALGGASGTAAECAVLRTEGMLALHEDDRAGGEALICASVETARAAAALYQLLLGLLLLRTLETAERRGAVGAEIDALVDQLGLRGDAQPLVAAR